MMTKTEEMWKADYQEFAEATRSFYQKEMDTKTYKGISGGFGSYAQRGAEASMLRLRMPGGRMDKTKLKFIVDAVEKYHVDKAHFTTCQALQLHNLNEKTVTELAVGALSVGIVTRGGGGDFPRNTMMSPLSGVEKGEYFNVLPYALAVGEYALGFIRMKKMPRKLKIGFSNTPKNIPHATYRDLGFVARPDGRFDVYSAGGLGNHPLFGVKVAENVAPDQLLYYVKAMYDTFCAYGNYENRGRARTRFMQEICGGAESYKKAYLEKLDAVYASGEDLTLTPEKLNEAMAGGFDETAVVRKAECAAAEADAAQAAELIANRRVTAQKQAGLYAVKYHPVGGSPKMDFFRNIYETIRDMDQVELRIAPDESVYVINCTADEAARVIAATPDSALTIFEESVACIGASICQQGIRDSQELVHALVDMEREEGFADGVLPQIHISGCPSSCGTHQTGVIGFHGCVKMIDKVGYPAFTLHYNGCEQQGHERMGEQLGVLLQSDIPSFVKDLGNAVRESGTDFAGWMLAHPDGVKEIAARYIG
jgi:ferredoxin-nitrite reductase